MADKYNGVHETLGRDNDLKTSSDRSFGLVFTGVFALASVYCLIIGSTWWLPFSILAGCFLLAALFVARILAPFNKAWTKLGLVLFTVISPIVLGIIFYLCVTPVGLLMRASGKDPMHRKFDSQVRSYWIPRDPPGPPGKSLENQF